VRVCNGCDVIFVIGFFSKFSLSTCLCLQKLLEFCICNCWYSRSSADSTSLLDEVWTGTAIQIYFFGFYRNKKHIEYMYELNI